MVNYPRYLYVRIQELRNYVIGKTTCDMIVSVSPGN